MRRNQGYSERFLQTRSYGTRFDIMLRHDFKVGKGKAKQEQNNLGVESRLPTVSFQIIFEVRAFTIAAATFSPSMAALTIPPA